MTLITLKQTWTYRDAKGWVKPYRYFVTADSADAAFDADVISAVGTLEAAISGLTNAAEQTRPNRADATTQLALVYGSTSTYQQNWIEARMMFVTSAMTRHIFGIGAPKIAIFDTDGTTVLNDGTQALVVAYINAVKNASGGAFISDAQGHAFTNFVGGLLKIGKQPRRFNEMVKSSHLVQGEGE